MENNEILDLLEQEYLQEYRKIQNRLLKKIRESSYLNVELHDIANQLYTAQLRSLQPQVPSAAAGARQASRASPSAAIRSPLMRP